MPPETQGKFLLLCPCAEMSRKQFINKKQYLSIGLIAANGGELAAAAAVSVPAVWFS